MTPFPDASDQAWLAELREAGLVTPDRTERIDAALGRPERGNLNAFLLAGAGVIPDDEWLCWLIRGHGCHRYGRVRWRPEAAAWASEGLPPDGNLPVRACAPGVLLAGLLRPDRRDASAARLGGRVLWAAATLGELAELHQAWRRAASGARR